MRIAIEIGVFLFLGMTAREYARAWMAARLGDPTPRLWGRLTLNPRAWFDPFGSGFLSSRSPEDLHLHVTSRFAFAFRLTAPVTALRAMPGAHKQKALFPGPIADPSREFIGRGERIRTSDPSVPNRVLSCAFARN